MISDPDNSFVGLPQTTTEAHQNPVRTAVCGAKFPRAVLIACGVWLVAVVAGSALMVRYAEAPGAAIPAPEQWPEGSAVARDAGRATLLVFVHPQCPCSRATIGELAVLMAHCQGKVSAQVWFLRPAGMTTAWMETDLWDSAKAIPGVQVHADEAGVEARRFHAETSGQTLLYGADGSLRFQGGITLARGHSGDNAGRSAVEAMVSQPLLAPVKTPVFGCGLSETECQQGKTLCTQ